MASLSALKKILAQRAASQQQNTKKSQTVRKFPRRRSPAAPSVSKQSDPIGTATVTCSSLNVRNGAGTQYERIGGLTNGKVVEVYEEKGGWLRIKYGSQDGWISKQYTDYKPNTVVTPEPKPDPQPDPQPDPPESFTSYQAKVTSSNGVNVRDVPGNGTNAAPGSTILGAIGYGTVVTVLDEQNGWLKINYGGQEGWICGTWTEKVGGGNVQDPQNPQNPQNPENPPINPGTGQKAAVDLAYSFLGQTTKNLLGTLPYLQDLSGISGTNNGYDLNCANFVSAILQNCGLLGSHSNTVDGVRSLCTSFGYHTTSKGSCKPGDVWCNAYHTELVYENNGGNVKLIGSNNGGDDIQEISIDGWSAGYYSDATYYSLQ